MLSPGASVLSPIARVACRLISVSVTFVSVAWHSAPMPSLGAGVAFTFARDPIRVVPSASPFVASASRFLAGVCPNEAGASRFGR